MVPGCEKSIHDTSMFMTQEVRNFIDRRKRIRFERRSALCNSSWRRSRAPLEVRCWAALCQATSGRGRYSRSGALTRAALMHLRRVLRIEEHAFNELYRTLNDGIEETPDAA
jgi:hypothetical protein